MPVALVLVLKMRLVIMAGHVLATLSLQGISASLANSLLGPYADVNLACACLPAYEGRL